MLLPQPFAASAIDLLSKNPAVDLLIYLQQTSISQSVFQSKFDIKLSRFFAKSAIGNHPKDTA
ncbi:MULTISPECIES: hypothetical protein [unclassified Microcoleus]|uniref:hypothetical protein n=1 Tax=unclassified Microcoleus TaxID=2642155 RepID=UPI001D3884EA|nr:MULTISPECIES: hypothetical protein [unclassified Microcoleus]MCC3581799.1 hypothetical protein [Microcoleus sp. PH2017_32_RDM_D_A]TAE07829.1 MAG: hypothetical protein EAZ94_27285 [Oscillatoriales cyanobacterium]MCC3593847.1 hypothetical protein [Microcoleus sp. PH2017_28_MFU_U_A]MCC3595823.1 hypothetical protein [Microcoleus sp. PH2017_26_ELK_O_A]MCC3619761.1 hypothetical protein [Microcoleus sp. PH2017_38_RDM_U_B]